MNYLATRRIHQITYPLYREGVRTTMVVKVGGVFNVNGNKMTISSIIFDQEASMQFNKPRYIILHRNERGVENAMFMLDGMNDVSVTFDVENDH